MGRQAAGLGFLRAAVAARGEEPLVGYGPRADSAAAFAAQVQEIDPGATTRWLASHDLGAFNRLGVCYLPHPGLGPEGRLRLRAGPARYCLCGVTHTTASPASMSALAGQLVEPLMPWDAIICTSEAVAETVRQFREAEADYLRWRLGGIGPTEGPQLPVIPLGVHCDDFAFTDRQKAEAREALGIEPHQVVALYVGRLSFAAKAHPAAMLQGLQAAAVATGQQIVLIQCGWAPNAAIAEAFESGAAWLAPDVRTITLDGREAEARSRAWAAGDLFISLPDNVQETFGLTPLEAMAASLPVVVTDWNGYRDTVRDGVDGFRVRTWAPAPGMGETYARQLEAGTLGYDGYTWASAVATSVDHAQLTDCLTTLITRPELRHQMGITARGRAEEFDWAKVYRDYQALWGELNARRLSVEDDADMLARLTGAPSVAPNGLDPFQAFGHYPTATVGPQTFARLLGGRGLANYQAATRHMLFGPGAINEMLAARILSQLEKSPTTIEDLAAGAQCGLRAAVLAVCAFAKVGIVILEP